MILIQIFLTFFIWLRCSGHREQIVAPILSTVLIELTIFIQRSGSLINISVIIILLFILNSYLRTTAEIVTYSSLQFLLFWKLNVCKYWEGQLCYYQKRNNEDQHFHQVNDLLIVWAIIGSLCIIWVRVSYLIKFILRACAFLCIFNVFEYVWFEIHFSDSVKLDPIHESK